MKVLIVGFGSIGKRHFDILSSMGNIESIDIVTKQTLKTTTTFVNIEDINNLKSYDYFIIASETSKHYRQLKYICSKVNKKSILVEKPIFDKNYSKIKTDNIIKVAYNLRFHPIFEKIKGLIKNEDIYFVNVICGQYLPTWRPERDYTQCYSAFIKQGGGVLRDLSHELDYISWLFGDIELKESISTKVSNLNIHSDDIFTTIGITSKNTIVNISLDYISKIPFRKLLIHTRTKTIEVDMINNTIRVGNETLEIKDAQTLPIDKNYTYTKMHEAMISGESDNICSFSEALKTVVIIDGITYEEF